MKKFVLASAVALVAAANVSAGALDDVLWRNGSSYQSSVALTNNNSAISFSILFGEFPEGTTVECPYNFDGTQDATKKVSFTTPEGAEKFAWLNTVSYYDAINQIMVDVPNAFKFTVDQWGMKTPGAYTFTFPAGCMKVNGSPIEESVVTLSIEDNRQFTPTAFTFDVSPNPAFKVNELTGVRLSYANRWPEVAGKSELRYKAESPNPTVTPYFVREDGSRIEAKAQNAASVAGSGYANIEVIPSAVITAAGVYTLVIPEGALRFTEYDQNNSSSTKLVCNTEVTYQFTLDGGSDLPAVDMVPIFSPAPGKIAKLTRLQMETPSDNYQLYLPDKILGISLTKPDGSVQHVLPYTNENVEGLFIFVDKLDEYFTTPGRYSFTFPRGCFEYYNLSTAGWSINEEFSINYELLDIQEREFTYTATPVDGTVVYGTLPTFYVLFDEEVTFSAGSKAQLTYPSGQTVNCSISLSTAQPKLTIDPGYPSEAGEYTLTIPARTVMDADNVGNAEIVLHYTLAERKPTALEFTTKPAEGIVSELEMISLVPPSNVVKCEPSMSGTTFVTFRDSEGNEVRENLRKTNDPLVYRIELPVTYTTPGEYALIIPENSYRVTLDDGVQCVNEQMVFTWTIELSGVEGVAADENAEYYNVNGTRVNGELLPGVYVRTANGKTTKLIVK